MRILCWIRSSEGSTAVEYAVLLGLLTAVMLGTVRSLGNASSGTIGRIAEAMAPAPEEPIALPGPEAPTIEIGPPRQLLP